MTIERAPPDQLVEINGETPVAGISANCWINSIGLSIVLWWLILKGFGVL